MFLFNVTWCFTQLARKLSLYKAPLVKATTQGFPLHFFVCVCVFTACPTKMMLQLFCCLVLLFGNSVAQSNGKFLFFMMTIKRKGKYIHPYNNNCIILQRYISFLYIFTISAGQIGKYCSSKFDIIK